MSMPAVNAHGTASAQKRCCWYSGGGAVATDSVSSAPNWPQPCIRAFMHWLRRRDCWPATKTGAVADKAVHLYVYEFLKGAFRRQTTNSCSPARLLYDSAGQRAGRLGLPSDGLRTSGGMAAPSCVWLPVQLLRAACGAPAGAGSAGGAAGKCKSPATGCLMTLP